MAAMAGSALILVVALGSAGEATHTPANKVWVGASSKEVLHPPQTTDGATETTEDKVLTVAKAKFSNPADLRISVTAECALWTNTATVGDDDSESKARVELWVTIDGNVVPVSADDTVEPVGPFPGTPPISGPVDPDVQGGPGRVVFCNRATRMKTEQIETGGSNEAADLEDDILIRSYNRTRTANAFNWGAMNVGRDYDEGNDNIVTIQVHGRLATELKNAKTTDNNAADFSPAAKAVVGKRTLYVEPVKMANDATF